MKPKITANQFKLINHLINNQTNDVTIKQTIFNDVKSMELKDIDVYTASKLIEQLGVKRMTPQSEEEIRKM